MIDISEAKKIGEMLAALGEPTRMRLIEQLTQGSQYVGELADVLGVPMVNVSHHLGVLRNAGLIEATKQGRRVSYSIFPDIFTVSRAQDAIGTLQIGSYRLTISRNGNDAKPEKSKRRG